MCFSAEGKESTSDSRFKGSDRASRTDFSIAAPTTVPYSRGTNACAEARQCIESFLASRVLTCLTSIMSHIIEMLELVMRETPIMTVTCKG